MKPADKFGERVIVLMSLAIIFALLVGWLDGVAR